MAAVVARVRARFAVEADLFGHILDRLILKLREHVRSEFAGALVGLGFDAREPNRQFALHGHGEKTHVDVIAGTAAHMD